MVREDETAGRDERAGPAGVETDGGKPDVVEPRVGRVEAVDALEFILRDVVVDPHSLVGADDGTDGGEQDGDDAGGTKAHMTSQVDFREGVTVSLNATD